MLTDDDIKKMLNGIINNNEEWEVCVPADIALSDLLNNDGSEHIIVDQEYEWHPYKLGDEIHKDWDYRKVDKWFVVKFKCSDRFEIFCNNKPNDRYCTTVFESNTKEDCESWIEEHTKKSWFEENYGESDWITDDIDANIIRINSIEDFSKKLLDEVKNNCFKSWMPQVSEDVYNVLKNLIKNLGVNCDRN